MSFLRRRPKPAASHPIWDLTWRRPRSALEIPSAAADAFNQPDCLFSEDALSLNDAIAARVRNYGADVDHG